MKVIKICADGDIGIIDIDFKNLDAVYNEIGGFEVVRTKELMHFFSEPVVMVVDDNFFAHGKPYNHIASEFYAGDICGDVLLVPEQDGNFIEFEDVNAACIYLSSFVWD